MIFAAWLALVPDRAVAVSASLGDASADRAIADIVVPEPSRKVGEVRLLARGEAVVVQTLLSTKLLSRVIAEIRKKEEANWPAGDPSTAAYLDALESARKTVERRAPAADWVDRRRRLLIEFAADANSEAVYVGTFRYAKDGSDRSPHDREVFNTLALPRAYILRNIRLILADSFKMPVTEVDRLGPLGPASASASASSLDAATGASPDAATGAAQQPAAIPQAAPPGAIPKQSP
ncbi:MAG: hypothetical protein ABR587_09545 [Candidatus Binatia bacterium]